MIVVFTAVTLLVKAGLISWLCVLLGRTWDTALLVGASLAASAEFSFILARLGVDEGVLTEKQFEVIVAATAASIVLAPAMYAPIPSLLRWLNTLPRPIVELSLQEPRWKGQPEVYALSDSASEDSSNESTGQQR